MSRAGAGVLAAAGILAHASPALTSITPMRTAMLPSLSGIGNPKHVALTFDDGPDPEYTPEVLARLDEFGVRATFFMLGMMAARYPELAREVVEAGHEIALHGYQHRLLLRRGPRATHHDLEHGRRIIEDATGTAVRWWRPPYGVLTGPSLASARRMRLTPVLWTAWGRDWTTTATPQSVLRTVRSGLRPGATILLHDSDCTSAAGSSRAMLGALPDLVRRLLDAGYAVGPLREHGIHGATATRDASRT